MVAVLFTDLVGSTDLMSRLGEASFDELRGTHFAALAQAIERSGGEEIKNTGDGVMATFGSVVDAVDCAVAIQQTTDRQARTAGTPLAIRVGLSVGEATFEADDVFGVPVVEAARLVAAARPGQIVTTAIAKALAAGRAQAEFSDLGPLELKGLPQPVAACEVLWAPLPDPTVPMPALLTDVGRIFVGRDRELERLQQMWKEAAAGERRVALIAGEPGVGKTRLAAELAKVADAEGAVVLAGRCDEDLGVPYQPFVEALRHFVAHTPVEELGERLGRYGGELGRLVPELAERVTNLPKPLRSDPETERYRLFDAVAAWLGAATPDQPLLLVLDDLQWAAKPTLLLLRHVVRSPQLKRIIAVGTFRDTELGHDHPLIEVLADLRRQDGVERLSLSGLDQAGVAAFVESAAGHDLEEEDLILARAIHEETEGNPFFVREVLRHLAETGAVERREARWATRLPVEELGIPEGVREVVGRRLSRLSAVANRALRVAAVVGAEFELPVLQSAGDFDEESLLSALDEALEARLVIEAPGMVSRYRFGHALVRDTLYGELSAARRVALHRRVAEAIEVLHAAALDDRLPALAYHWARAAAPATTARAVDYATRAGDRALAQLAHDEAAAYYRQALEFLEVSPGWDDDARRLRLLLLLGEAQGRAGESTCRATLLRAARMAEEQGDGEALARAALASGRGNVIGSVTGTVDIERVAVLEAALRSIDNVDSPIRAQLMAVLSLELLFAGDLGRCWELNDEALAMARRLGDPATLGEVLLTRYFTVLRPDKLTERLDHTAELLVLADQLADPALRYRSLWLRYRAAVETGDGGEARRSLEAAEQVVTELGQPILRWLHDLNRNGWLLLTGAIHEAATRVREHYETGRAMDQPDSTVFYAFQMFEVCFEQGRLSDVEQLLADLAASTQRMPVLRAMHTLMLAELERPHEASGAVEELAPMLFNEAPFDAYWLRAMTAVAAVCAELQDRERSAVLYRRLVPYADQIVVAIRVASGSVSHYLGLLAATLGQLDEAAVHFAAAADMHVRIGGPTWLARTRLEWARMLLARQQVGDDERARDLLGQALATARELGLGNVESQAVALLQ